MGRGGVYAGMVAAQSLRAGEEGSTAEGTIGEKAATDAGVDGIRGKETDEQEEEVAPIKENVMVWALKLNKPEWAFLLLGVIGAIIDGVCVCVCVYVLWLFF
jgi:hypothetical protein